MRKFNVLSIIYLLIICLVIVMIGCSNSNNLSTKDDPTGNFNSVTTNVVNTYDTININQCVYNINSLSVYQLNDKYKIIIEKYNGQKTVSFTNDREAIDTVDIELQDIDDLSMFLGMNINEVKQQLGEVHVDIGSGFYIPSYVTSDAYLVSFRLEEDGVIDYVIKRDIFNGNVVERVSK